MKMVMLKLQQTINVSLNVEIVTHQQHAHAVQVIARFHLVAALKNVQQVKHLCQTYVVHVKVPVENVRRTPPHIVQHVMVNTIYLKVTVFKHAPMVHSAIPITYVKNVPRHVKRVLSHPTDAQAVKITYT